MTSETLNREPVFARDDERAYIEQLEMFYKRQHAATGGKIVGATGEEIELPESVLTLLRDIVHVLARGEAVSIVEVQKSLTTQQAADLLNISRQYLIRMLDRGDIPFHMVGTHRRLDFNDVMDYRRQRDARRREGLDRLTELSQDLGLYDDHPVS